MKGIASGATAQIDDFSSYIFNPADAGDTRLTNIGRVLRRTSVDELPQLLNVVLGQMALVGPRPELPGIVSQYPKEYHSRHSVLPGVTGEAQVTGRSNLNYGETMAKDISYLSTRTPKGDLRILWRTIFAVGTGEGAR
jgi:lipopolysaccharide/colanic/teichoic acid biosynthesis glycosyltransferase